MNGKETVSGYFPFQRAHLVNAGLHDNDRDEGEGEEGEGQPDREPPDQGPPPPEGRGVRMHTAPLAASGRLLTPHQTAYEKMLNFLGENSLSVLKQCQSSLPRMGKWEGWEFAPQAVCRCW